MGKRTAFAQLFWANVRRVRNGCRKYVGTEPTASGHSLAWDPFQRRKRPAHHIAYELSAGPISNGARVTSTCRHTWCVNPAHLRQIKRAVQRLLSNRLPRADHPVPKTAEYRAQFWSRIDRRVECWAPMWYLPRAKQCYVRDPSLGPGRKRSAQFIAYTLEIGPVPADSFVRPSCGTPACVRPQHLTLATQHTVNAKLTLKQVQALRAERANNPKGTTLAGLAKKYKISVPSIARILAGTNYRQASGGVPVRLPLKVSPQTVRALRAERVTDPHGTTIAGLAKKYKISAGTVAGILYGRLYRAVTGGIPVLRPSEQA